MSTDDNVFNIFHDDLSFILKEMGFKKPTKAQEEAIPILLQGKNLLLISDTGSGKTEASLFPLIHHLLTLREKRPLRETILCLYITPLRALNRDMFKRFIQIGKKLDISIDLRHGDTPQSRRSKQLKSPPHILITTPETLQALLTAPKMRENLRTIGWVVIDETHELAASKRGTQLTIALERLEALTNTPFVRIGLSATVDDPVSLAEFLCGTERDYSIVDARSKNPPKLKVTYPKPTKNDEVLASKINSSLDSASRIRYLREQIESSYSTLVFTNTRHFSETLGNRLRLSEIDANIMVHHGSLSKQSRIEAEDLFKQESLDAIICTSSLELGIDIGSIDNVIQYMSPRQTSSLIQRVGRSHHHIDGQSTGEIITISGEDAVESAAICSLVNDTWIEPINYYSASLDVLAHQVVGLTLEYGEITASEVFNIIIRAHPYRTLTKEKLDEVILFFHELNNIWVEKSENDLIIKRRKDSFQYYYSHLGTIPDRKSIPVKATGSNRQLATLSDDFLAKYGKIGNIIVIKGTTWQIDAIEEEDITVTPYQTKNDMIIPSWVGQLIPVPYKVAQTVGNLWGYVTSKLLLNENIIFPKKYEVDKNASEVIIKSVDAQLERITLIGTDTVLLIESAPPHYILHICLGSQGNETLGRILSSLFAARLGASVRLYHDPYRIMLSFSNPIKPASLESQLLNLDPAHVPTLIRLLLRQSDVYLYQFRICALRFGIIQKESTVPYALLRRIAMRYDGSIVEEETISELLHDLDIESVQSFLNQLQKNEITVHHLKSTMNTLSPFALNLVKRQSFGEFILPERPIAELAKTVKKRLLAKRMRFVCMRCAKFNVTRIIEGINEPFLCPSCKSNMIAVSFESDHKLASLVNKHIRGLELSTEEKQKVKKAYKTASLVQASGKNAMIVLAGHGVGPETASRILFKIMDNKDEIELYVEIMRAEKQYSRTKPFWSTGE
ncbi:MAG: DEAD/DEAH box helicase [Candidatus Kariarchaeaceae archaeon]